VLWLIPIMLITVWLGAIPVLIHMDKKSFNNGICTECGHKLRHFDNDSQGGEGWCCDHCNNVVWVSWI